MDPLLPSNSLLDSQPKYLAPLTRDHPLPSKNVLNRGATGDEPARLCQDLGVRKSITMDAPTEPKLMKFLGEYHSSTKKRFVIDYGSLPIDKNGTFWSIPGKLINEHH
jgi:hypothetical protein